MLMRSRPMRQRRLNTDGDGVGDNADAYPNDPTRTELDIAVEWNGIQGYVEALSRGR